MGASRGDSDYPRRSVEPTQGDPTQESTQDESIQQGDLYIPPWTTRGNSPYPPHLVMGQGNGLGPADAGLDTYFLEYPDPWAHSYLPVNALARTSNVQVPNDIYNPPERFGQAHQWISQDFGFGLVPPLSAFEAPLGAAHTPMHNNPPIAGPMGGDNTVTKATETRVVFACCHEDCPFTANSKRDVRRHLNTDKHRKDHVEGLPSEDKYYCEVPNCKFAIEGFSRRDNMLRHMSTIHNIELEREKRGRKRNFGA